MTNLLSSVKVEDHVRAVKNNFQQVVRTVFAISRILSQSCYVRRKSDLKPQLGSTMKLCLKCRSKKTINNRPFLKDTLQSCSCSSLKSLKKHQQPISIHQRPVTRLHTKPGTVHPKARKTHHCLPPNSNNTCWSKMTIRGKISRSSLKVTRLSIRQAHRKAARLTCHWQWRQRLVKKRYRMRSSIVSICTRIKLSKLERLVTSSMQTMQDCLLGAEAAPQTLHRQRRLYTLLALVVSSLTRRKIEPLWRSKRLSESTSSGESYTE